MAEASAQSNPPALPEELASIAARAQTYTGASGAAIALSEGDQNEMVCRACSGPSAPDVGAHLRLEGTFTGMAVQSGQALRCDDSDTDKRVDAAACRALGTRSIVVVPIRDADTEVISGVLAVFAGGKNSFNDLHVAVLRTMAREVAVAVQKARKAGISITAAFAAPFTQPVSPRAAMRASDPGFTPPPLPAPSAPVASGAAAAAKPAPEPPATVMSPAPTPRPPAPKPEAPRAPAAEELQPVASPIVPVRRASAPPAEWKPAPPPPQRKAEPAESPRAESSRSTANASFGTFDSVAQDKKPGGGGMGIWIGVAAALVLIVAGYFTYNHFSGQPAAPQQTAQQQSPAPAATPAPATTAPATGTTTTTPISTTASTQTTTQPAATTTAAKSTPTPPPTTQKPAQQAASQPPPPQQTPPQAKPVPQAVERAAVTPGASSRQDAPPAPIAGPAPQIAVPISTSTPTLAAASKVSQSTGATLISQVSAKYPEMAKTMRAEGIVAMEAVVGTDGSVKSVKVISGHSLLREAATSAVRQYRYKPATLNGSPVESTVQVNMRFQAPR
jgi:TonB family protein